MENSFPLRLSDSLNTTDRIGRRKHSNPLSIQEDSGASEQFRNRKLPNWPKLWHRIHEFLYDRRIAELSN